MSFPQTLMLELTEDEIAVIEAYAEAHDLLTADEAVHAMIQTMIAHDNKRWDDAFKNKPHILKEIARRGRAEIEAGEVEDFDIEESYEIWRRGG